MSLVSQAIKLYAWKSNNVRFLAVEGEADSRMFYIQLYNTSAPIDLTNSNVKFFASKPDSTSVYCDCTIVDDIQGIVQLVLPEQMTTVSGDVDCWIQVTSADGSDLRFEGMVLEVASCGLNASAESSDDMETLREASQKVDAFTTELRNARFGEDSLGEKIEKMDRKSASNSSRIDSLVASATEQDQNFANEVIDARTDSTGTTHSSLGEALRTTDALVRECKSDLVDQGLLLQTHSQKIDTLEADSTSLKSDLSQISSILNDGRIESYVNGFYNFKTGVFSPHSEWKSSSYFPVLFYPALTTDFMYTSHKRSFISLKNNGVYVGSIRQGKYYDTTETQVSTIAFTDFALCIQIVDIPNYDIAWFDTKSNVSGTANALADGTINTFRKGFYNFTTAVFSPHVDWESSSFFPKSMFYMLNTDFLYKGAKRSFISLKNNGVYVGTLRHDGYYDSTETKTSSVINFDEFALCIQILDVPVYDIAWFDKKISLNDYESLSRKMYDGKLEWLDGYYKMHGDGEFVSASTHKSTEYMPKYMRCLVDESYFLGNIANAIVFKNNGSYVGYYQASKYYNPSDEEQNTIEYDEFAIIILTSFTNYLDFKLLSLDNLRANKVIYTGIIDVWYNGYYSLTGTNAGDFVTVTTHKCTDYYPAYLVGLIKTKYHEDSTANALALKRCGKYIGYYQRGKYYNTSGTQVDAFYYDSFAVILRNDTSDYQTFRFFSIKDISVDGSKLTGKKLGVIGDSICAGAGYAGGYGKIIGEMYGMTVENKGVNGATLVPTENLPQILPQLTALSSNCDYIILEGGFNDSWKGNAIGTFSTSFDTPTADGTFYGNLNYLLYNALQKYNGKKMCYVIVHQSRTSYSVAHESEYYKATIKLCNKWGIPVVDLNKNCPPLGLVSSSNPLYTTYTNNDGVHPNEAGYKKYYVPQIVAMLESL